MPRRLSPELDRAIAELRQQGLSYTLVAKQLGIHPDTVQRYCNPVARAGHRRRAGVTATQDVGGALAAQMQLFPTAVKRKPRSDRVYASNAERQRAYRARKRSQAGATKRA
jgi:transposase-like protein